MLHVTFEEEVAYLGRHAPVDVLASPAGGRVAVCAHWQGRVMTSAVAPGGASIGFVNRPFIEAGRTGTHFDNYGGEDRLWLGPEAGQYGFFFPPGARFTLATWQVPAALQEGAWTGARRTDGEITLKRPVHLTNYRGVSFEIDVERTVRLLDAQAIASRFGLRNLAGMDARCVAYETVNRVTNVGPRRWERETGLPSVWVLGQYPTAADAVVVIPLVAGDAPAVNDRYFGRVPPERLAVRERDARVLFCADGRLRSKIGVPPSRTGSVLGSIVPSAGLVTVVRYSRPDATGGATGYVNSLWEMQSSPYDGDIVNSYNDGPVDGTPPLAPFYELETSSPAAELAPGESLTHANATLHVVAAPAQLDRVARDALGTPLDTLRF